MSRDQEKSRDELSAEIAELKARLAAAEAGGEVGSGGESGAAEFMQNLFESLPDPMYMVDSGMTILKVNERMCDFLGLAAEDMIGRRFQDVLPPAAAFIFVSNDERVFALGDPDIDIEMLSDHTGMVRPYSSTRTVFTDPATGEPVLATLLRDASELMEARQALVESNHFLHAVLDAIPHPLFVKDTECRYSFVNSSFEHLVGKCNAEIMGRTVLDLYPDPEQAARLQEADTALVEDGKAETVQHEDVFTYADGTARDMVLNKVLVRDTSGAATSIVGTLFDVSRLKRVERELAGALEDLDTIIENSLVGIMFVRRRLIAKVNRKMSEICGYSRSELVGSKIEKLHVSRESFLEFGREYYPKIADGPIMNVEYPFRRKDGSEMWCKLSGSPLDVKDLSRGFVWVVDDITELKKAQEFREDVDRMARHDLKTPLQGVIGYSALLQEDENITGEQQWMLREIEKSGDQMIRMIDVSLSLFKLENRTYAIAAQPVDIVELVRRVRMELLNKSRFSGMEVECLLDGTPLEPDDVFKVKGDELLLYSMLANLIKNGLESGEQADSGQRVQVRLERWDGIKIVIHNDQAVPEEIRDTFFEKYATSGKRGGSGLGTFSAKLIVDSHGGSISMTTSESRGTSVTVRLPE